MIVKRIVSNIQSDNLEEADAFYSGIFDLELLMDLGWIKTFGSEHKMPIQISIAKDGGAGTPLPDISIEVDNLEEVYSRVMRLGIAVEYGPVTETWGLRRFFVRDPFGKLLNVSEHR